MATKNTKHDPLEAAKITDDRASADLAALGPTMPVDPTRPPAATGGASVEAGQFVPPSDTKPEKPSLRDDGPTIEEWIAAGYKAVDYPPSGYAEKPSPGLTRHKAGGKIEQEWIDAARAKLSAERGEKPPAPKKVVYVVLADGRGNCGGGQLNFFHKGDVLELAGYGDRGIKRLIDSGLKLERKEV